MQLVLCLSETYGKGCIGRCLHLSVTGVDRAYLGSGYLTDESEVLSYPGCLILDETLVTLLRQSSWWRACLEVGHGRC